MSGTPVDVLVVTALKEELDALLEVDLGGGQEAWRMLRDRAGLPYHIREVRNDKGETLRVATAWSGEMGESAAATRAAGLLDELDPACLAMCGICAGNKRKGVFLGDVIVADRVFSYDHGKLVASRTGEEGTLFRDITTYNLETTWKMEAAYFAQEYPKEWKPAVPRPVSKKSQTRWLLFALDAHERGQGEAPASHPDRKLRCLGWADRLQELSAKGLIETTRGQLRLTEEGRSWVAETRLRDPDEQERDPEFRVHVGPIATGKTVREDPELFNRLSQHVRKVLGAEMEAAAIGFVAERSGMRSIIVKAASDHGDHDKDDGYRDFACHASAAFLLAFLRRHLRTREPGQRRDFRGRARRMQEDAEESGDPARKSRREDFLGRVMRACMLREPQGTEIVTRQSESPFNTYLEVSVREGQFLRVYPLGALDQLINREALEIFIEKIHQQYARENTGVISTIIHVGQAAPPELVRLAGSKRVNLFSFAEYQGLIDFTEYLKKQTARLDADAIYPHASYVAQRGMVSVGGQLPKPTEDVLEALRELIGSPDKRFALVLGDFGTGKTFLLHELARRMGQEGGGGLLPVLVELRALQKQRTLRELVAQHFAAADVQRFEMEKFLYMLREGRVALLFDGFDELALRVTYDGALEHFSTLINAAEGKAKVIVTSRTQHFLADHDVKRELARMAEALPGYRLIKLERFSEMQIHQFLVKRLGSEAAAEERMELLRDVRDLLGLSENPRLLSFIVDLDAEQLRAARDGSGEITSAKLYGALIEKWLQGEHMRVNPPAAPKGLSLEQLRHGATELALLLWERMDRTVSMDELPSSLLQAVKAQGEHELEQERIKHQLGSGSLLVRDEDGRFSFIHQSVMEWLVADATAREVREGRAAPVLDRNEVSELMADFLIALAGREPARTWAESVTAAEGNDRGKRNALRVLDRMRQEDERQGRKSSSTKAKNLEGSDLRGQNLTNADLRGANLNRANLSGSLLIRADLTGAQLRQAVLQRADLWGARLAGADLTGADLKGADLMEADLRGAKLSGTKLHMAKLVGAQVDSLEGSDLFGAALPGDVKPLPQLAPGSERTTAACSPDGTMLATGHENGSIYLREGRSGVVVRILSGHRDPVTSIAFSPGGTAIAAVSRDGEVGIWDLPGGGQRKRWRTRDFTTQKIVFGQDGALLAGACDDGQIRLWRVDTGQLVKNLGGHIAMVLSVAFSPDGTLLASASEDWTVRLWSLDTGKEIHVFHKLERSATDVVFSPDGALLAAASSDGSVRIWHLGDRRILQHFRGDADTSLEVAFSRDGAMIAAISRHGIQIWGVGDGAPLANWTDDFSLSDESMNRVFDNNSVFINQGIRVMTNWALADMFDHGVIKLFRILGRMATERLNDPICSLAFTKEKMLVGISESGSVFRWDMATSIFEVMTRADFSQAGFNQDGSRLFVLDAVGSSLEIMDLTEGKRVRSKFKRQSGDIKQVALGRYILATVSSEGRLTLWNVSTREAREINSLRGRFIGATFSPDGSILALVTHQDSTIALLRDPEGQPRFVSGHEHAVKCVAFSDDGQRLVSVDDVGVVLVSHVATGENQWVRSLGRGVVVRAMSFSSASETIAFMSATQGILLWNLKSDAPMHPKDQYKGTLLCMAFSHDGAMLAAAYDDGMVCLYEVATGRVLAMLLWFEGDWVALRHDGRFKRSRGGVLNFWYSIGLCRFEPQELTPYLPAPLQLRDDEPFLP